MVKTFCAVSVPFEAMLRSRFHPAAEEELLEAGRYIKADDVVQGKLFEKAFEEALDWACSEAAHLPVLRKGLPKTQGRQVPLPFDLPYSRR